MNHILKLHITLFFTIIVQGCNTIYFYETQKYSLTVEGRPDATSPASFNLGIKHRVASVVPEKGNLSDRAKYKGEAVSLISYFNLHKSSNPTGFFDDPILVETALISGKAAAILGNKNNGKDKAGEILNIISSSNHLADSDFVYITNLFHVLKQDAGQGNKNAQAILTELTKVNEDLLDDKYPVTTYFVDAGSSPRNLTVEHKSNTKIKYAKNIIGLYDFLAELKKSTASIQTVLKKPDQYKVLGDLSNNQFVINGLKAAIVKTKEVSETSSTKLKKNSGYNKATKYYVENHLGLQLN